MNACPGIDTLERGGPDVAAHLCQCGACRSIADLMQVSSAGPPGDCARAELLIAAGAASPLGVENASFLPAHLARCPACRETALEPPSGQDQEPPRVSPDHYVLGAEIGRGGMGRVMAARDLRIGRAVALKEMLASDPQARARFEREARITARLQHPGIVSIYEVGRWPDGRPFYAMPILPGRTLGQALATAGNAHQRLRLLPALIAAADAVAYAHSRRIIHRDLTPANILLGSFGETIVIDWGVAKDLDDTAALESGGVASNGTGHPTSALTAHGSVIGTPAYIAPEQAEGEPVDERADVYALGAILYQLLAGRPPFVGSSAEVVARLRARQPPTDVGKSAPRDLRSVVQKAMAPTPQDRYPTARELVEELRRHQSGERVVAHRYSGRELAGRWLARRLPLVAVSSVLLTLLGVTAGVGGARLLREQARAAESTGQLKKIREQLQPRPEGTDTSMKAWSLSGSTPQHYRAVVDTVETWRGRPSARLESIIEAEGFGTLTQVFSADDYRGKRVRLSAQVKTRDANSAALWMRVDGRGEEPLAIDNMYNRPIVGTTRWTRHQVVLDVAPAARAIVFGALLGGQGKLWINDLSLEVVDGSVPITQPEPRPERATPRNLDFSEGDLTAQGTLPGWMPLSDQPHHYRLSLERDGSDGRKRAVSIQSTTPVGSKVYMMSQTIAAAAFHGKRLRLRGRMRTEALLRQAGLFMRVDGDDGEVVAYDNMNERPVKGTTPWQEYQVVLDIPAGSRAIAVGGWLTGGGGISLADLRLDVVDHTIPVTDETPRAPRNLDFRQ